MIIVISFGKELIIMLPKTYRHSKQRETMLKILQGTKSHPSAEWLYCEMKKEFPNISLATVYRNLNFLLRSKQIIRLDIGSGTEHYDADCSQHYHFVCNACNSIYDILFPNSVDLDNYASELNDISIESHSLIFYGMCGKCKKAESAFNNNNI